MPARKVVYPQCQNCGGRMRDVDNLLLDADDSDLPASMRGKVHTYTGSQCDDCERRGPGTYTPADSRTLLRELQSDLRDAIQEFKQAEAPRD